LVTVSALVRRPARADCAYGFSMARRRRPRPQEAGLWYHVATRGVRKLPIVHDDEDRATFLSHLGEVAQVFGWELTAFCLMTNHYHLVVRTPAPNIAAGMHRLNLVYAQVFNRKHGFAGHLFDARYWSGTLRTEDYFLDASRYVVLNPVRAELRKNPHEWEWSSYRQTVGLSPPAHYLSLDWLDRFDPDRPRAQSLYRSFVYEGIERAPATGA
jgi:putative transposase